MISMKRTFIAVKIDRDEKLEKAVQSIREELKNEQVKWVDLNQIHVTLSFLGDTSEGSIRDVSEMLIAGLNDFGMVELSIRGIGVFKSLADPRVIWAGISDSEGLSRLSQRINTGLNDLGILTEERPFNPHITIGRIRSLKNQGSLRKLIENYEAVEFQKARISEVVYYESILQQTGALYLPMKKIRLC
jgi:RNA 2',3'-cyclic 3'-phosphodiesterase